MHTINESIGTQKFFATHFKFFSPLTLIDYGTNYQPKSTERLLFLKNSFSPSIQTGKNNYLQVDQETLINGKFNGIQDQRNMNTGNTKLPNVS